MNDVCRRLFVEFPEEVLAVFTGDGDELSVDVDAVAVDAVDLSEGDGERSEEHTSELQSP